MEFERRKTWGEGPWNNEPDELFFEYKGFGCHIQRGPLGSLCGYAGIPRNYKVFDKIECYDDLKINAHGGLTFMESGTDKNSGQELYIIGFDCAHFGDIVPAIKYFTREMISRDIPYFNWPKGSYKDIDFVYKEIQSIVDQVLEIEENGFPTQTEDESHS